MTVVVVGSCNLDITLHVARLPKPGETVSGGDLRRGSGGKGANQAVAAARQGAEVLMVGCIGGDEAGRRFLDDLTLDRVDCTHLRAAPGVTTGTAFILVDAVGENQIAFAPGANALVSADDVRAAADAFTAAAVVLTELEVPIEAVGTALRLARERGATTILNPAPAPLEGLSRELLGLVDVIVPNRSEATALTGIEVTDAASAVRAAEALRTQGCAAAVVTLGADGAVVVDANGTTRVPAPVGVAVDATGAGDAFCGALAAAMAGGKSLQEAVRRSVVAGALAAGKPGALSSMPTEAEVDVAIALG